MVQFSPYPTPDNEPNYLGLSKEPGPIQGNTAMGKLFQGMGDMLEMGVKGLDTITKQKIDDELEGSLTAQRNAETFRAENTLYAMTHGKADPSNQPADPADPGASAAPPLSFAETATQQSNPLGDRASAPDSSNAPVASTGPLPGEVQRGLGTIARMNEANGAGKFSSTQMNMNVQAIISDVKQRYPGYRAEIDRNLRQMGFSQNGYLDDIKTQINQAAAKIDAADTKDATWEDKHADELARIQPNYFDLPRDQRRSPEFRDKLMTQIGQLQARNSDIKERIQGLDLDEKQNKVDITKIAQTATDAASNRLAVSLTGTVNVMGYKNIDALVADMNSGKDHLPEDITRMNAALEQFKQAQINGTIQDMKNTKIGNTTQYAKLGIDKANEIAKASALHIEVIQRGLSEKNYTLAGAAAAEAQMRLDRTGLAVSKAYPIVDVIKTFETKYGGPALQDALQNSPNAQAPVRAAVNQAITGGVIALGLGKINPATNQPVTVNDILKDFKNLGLADPNGKVNPNDAAALADHVKKNILSAPPALAATYSKAFFTSDLFARVPAKDKLSFLTNYASPQMTAKVLEAARTDPELLQQYKEFIHTGVLASTQQTVSDFKTVQNSTSTAFNANPYYKMTFNPETNRVDLTMTPTESIYAELGQTPSRYANINSQLRVVRRTVADLNTSLGILDPVLKSEKQNISGEMLQLLKSTGVKIPVKDEDKGSPALKFSDDELPSSGNVGSLDSFLANPAGNVAPTSKAPVVASGGRPTVSSNLTDQNILGIKVDNIPEGMSARDFLKRLQATSPALNGAAHARYRDQQ